MGSNEDADWQVLPDLRWRRPLVFEPIKLVARRRENGRWVYRDATKEEIAEYCSGDAW